MLICWCRGFECFTNPVYLTILKSSLITVLSNQGHICMFFSSIPFLSSWRVMHSCNPSEWQGVICYCEPRVISLHHRFQMQNCFPRSCSAQHHPSRINIAIISLMQKTTRGRPRHLHSGTSWDRANPNRKVVEEGRVLVKAKATGMYSPSHCGKWSGGSSLLLKGHQYPSDLIIA